MTQSNRLELRLSDELRDMLNELRRAERDMPNQSEMIRRLIMRELMRLKGMGEQERKQNHYAAC